MTTSNRYQHVSTVQVLDSLYQAGFTNQIAETVQIKRRKNSTSVHVARVPVGESRILFDTQIQPELVLFNSYGGESSLRARLGFFRAVCANGMTVGTTLEEVSIRHVKGPTFDTKYSQFFERIDVLLQDGFARLESQVSRGLEQGQMLAVIRRLEHILGKRAAETARILLDRREEDQTGNIWQLWNVTNEALRLNARSEVAYEERNARLLDSILKEVA